jgi:hypothetical protein
MIIDTMWRQAPPLFPEHPIHGRYHETVGGDHIQQNDAYYLGGHMHFNLQFSSTNKGYINKTLQELLAFWLTSDAVAFPVVRQAGIRGTAFLSLSYELLLHFFFRIDLPKGSSTYLNHY